MPPAVILFGHGACKYESGCYCAGNASLQNESSIIDKYMEKNKKAGSVTPISLGRGSALSNI